MYHIIYVYIYIYIYMLDSHWFKVSASYVAATKPLTCRPTPLPARPSGHVCAWGLVMGTRLRGPLAGVAESFSATPAAEESSNLVFWLQKHGEHR